MAEKIEPEVTIENKYTNMTPDQLVEVLAQEDLSDENKEEIAVEMIKSIGIKVAVTCLLTTTRYLNMTKNIKAVIEEDGEMYMFEFKKMADITPEKGVRSYDKDVSSSISVTVEAFK